MNPEPQYRTALQIALRGLSLDKQIDVIAREQQWLLNEWHKLQAVRYRAQHLTQDANGDLKVTVTR